MVRFLLVRSVTALLAVGLAISSTNACRTTTPTASSPKSDEERLNEPVAVPKSDGNFGVLRWVVATRSNVAGSEGLSKWNLVLKTDSEVWCEARCSKFELVEATQGDTNELRVKKTTIAGNTTPGMLDVQKEFGGKPESGIKLRLVNVGVRGESIVLDDVVTSDRPNFYAVPMRISSETNGEKSVLKGEFSGQTVELHLEKGVALPGALKLDSGSRQVFVMGSLLEEKSTSGERIHQFWAFKVIPSDED